MTTFPTQDHVHIAPTLSAGPEFSPVWKWKITDRIISPTGFLSINRSVGGKLRFHVAKSGGIPLLIKNPKYIIKLDPQNNLSIQDQVDRLTGMIGKLVYVCDSWHPDDNADHTSAVKSMAFIQLGDLKVFEQMLNRFYVEVLLEDNSI